MAQEVTFKLNLKVDGKNVVRELTVNIEDLRSAISATRTSAEQMTAAFIHFNQIQEGIQNISGAVSQLSGVLNSLTAESRSFGAAMASANTMAGKSGEDFANLKEQVSELSKTIPIARDQLANGLYQVISNGVPEGNWLEYLEQSAKASVGGIADLSETVKVTSTIIKNYGLAWSDAGSIQDKIQLTAKNGVTSFEQLAQALPRVTSNAATLGVSVDELMATFSTLTGVSGNTAEVSTQLAAIFTALVKPSSEATEMAEQMGIKFDAAAIKAAGGMEQFLASLDKSVKEYAASSGMLEQEIYGKLFGSAESLRALGPLTGQLADKFRENVADMKGSAGTIDEAFSTMASTGSSTLQMLNNKFGEVTDAIQSSIGNFLPYLNFGSQILITVSSVGQLGVAIKTLGVTTYATTVAVKAFNVAATAAASLTAAPFLAMAAGLGVLAAGYAGVKNQIENTDSKSRTLRETLADLRKEHENNNEVIRRYLPIAQDATKKTTDRKEAIAKLKALYPDYFKNLDIATSKQYEIAKAVNASNKAYRDQLVLIAKQAKMQYEKSKANYEKNQNGGQMGSTNAGANVMMNQQDKANVQADLKLWKEAEQAVKDYDKAMKQPAATVKASTQNTAKHNQTLNISALTYNQVTKAIEDYKKKLGNATNDPKEATRLNGILKRLEARKKSLEKTYDGLDTSSKKGNKAEPKFYKNPKNEHELSKNINYYEGKLTGQDTAEQRQLSKTIQLWKQKLAAIELAKKAALVPAEINTAKDVNAMLDYLNAKRDTATQDELPAIDKEISKTELRGLEIQRPKTIDASSTDEDIDKEIAYQQKLKATSEGSTDAIDKEIKRLERLKDKRTELQIMQDSLQEAQEGFDNAVTVEAKVKAKAKVDEIQAKIDEATNGKLSIQADVTPSYIVQGSVDDKRQSYSNAQSKANRIQQDFEIGLIGKNEAQKELEDLNKQITALDSKLKPLKIEVDSKSFEKSMSKIKDAWGSVQGIGSGIQSITDALDGDKDAWSAISGVINGFISVAEGVQGVVEIVKMLTGATNLHTTAEATKAVAVEASNVAETSSIAANTAAATATIGVIAVNKLATASFLEMAAASYFAAHAYIPFAGAAIASGFAAQAVAETKAIGALAAFAYGGIVGGSSTSGDKILVRVNSGEMILNAAQQARLFALANGAAYQESAQVQSDFARGGIQPLIEVDASKLQSIGSDMQESNRQSVSLRLRGRDLVGSLANETRSNSRRSNIKV